MSIFLNRRLEFPIQLFRQHLLGNEVHLQIQMGAAIGQLREAVLRDEHKGRQNNRFQGDNIVSRLKG